VAVVQRVAVIQGLVQNIRLGYNSFSRAEDLGPAVVDRWPLFRGGRYHRFDCASENKKQQDLLGQVSRLRKREGQKYVNFYGKS
jgi:hypothetical protein